MYLSIILRSRVLVGPRRSYYVFTYYGLAVAAGGEGLAASIVAVTGGADFYEKDRRCIPSPCLLLNDVEQCGQTICAAAASSPSGLLWWFFSAFPCFAVATSFIFDALFYTA